MPFLQDDLEAIAEAVGDQIPRAIARNSAIRALARMMKMVLQERYDVEVSQTLEAARDLAVRVDPEVGRIMLEELRALLVTAE